MVVFYNKQNAQQNCFTNHVLLAKTFVALASDSIFDVLNTAGINSGLSTKKITLTTKL
jgi:hypothetical protein